MVNNMDEKQKFLAYERVRREGRFNMFDPNARMLTGLSKEDYIWVMNNYSELNAKYGSEF